MSIKDILKQLSLGLLVASANGAAISTINCDNFGASIPEIVVKECSENDMGEITSLNLHGIINENLIQNLVNLSSLENFTIYHDSYKDDFDLSPLKSLKNLKSIDIDCYRHPKHKSHGSEIKEHSFDDLKTLEKLTLDGCDLLDEEPFIGLTNLKELSISVSRGEGNIPDLTYLKNHENLSKISFTNHYSINEYTIKTNLTEMNNLKSLEFTNFCLDQQTVNDISSMKNIEELDMNTNCSLEDIDFSPFRNIKDQIKSFVLDVNLNDSLKEIILSFTGLKKLDVNDVDSTYLQQITSELKNLEYLGLHGTITEIPESIKELKNLLKLDLSYNDISKLPDDMSVLENIVYLDLTINEIVEIPESIKQLNNLETFKISSKYGSSTLNEIPENLKYLENLKELEITNENIKEIPDYIKEFKNLKYLDLSDNYITEIPESLKELKNLETLYLISNDIEILPDFLNYLNLKDVNFAYNNNLRGKTLTNDSLVDCYYYSTKLCIADVNMKCIKSGYSNFDPCDKVYKGCEEIEKYLKDMDLSVYTITCYDDDDKNIEILKFEEKDLNEEIIDKILSYNSTKELEIGIDGSLNAVEKVVEQLPNLETLTIRIENNSLNLNELKNLKNLNYLWIISNEGLYSLKSGIMKSLTNLKDLSFSSVNISQTVINEISKLTNLQYLYFGACNYPSNPDFSNFKKLSSLESLCFNGHYEGKKPLYEIPSSIYKLTNLKSLSITGQEISKISSNISKLKNLTDLILSRNNITSIPKALNNLKYLEYIDFNSNPNLTGKTLTNPSLNHCYYDESSSICKTQEMECYGDENIKLC